MRTGPLARGDRDRLTGILERTGLFRPEEVAVALELFDETCPDDREPAAPALDEARSPDGSYRMLGAYRAEGASGTGDATLAAYVCWGPTPGTDRSWDLYWIAVDPDAQGAGIGSMLMSEVESRIGRESARMLIVETSSRPDYEPTRQFYRKLGYDEAARLGSYYAPDDDRVIYVKRFSQEPRGAEQRHE